MFTIATWTSTTKACPKKNLLMAKYIYCVKQRGSFIHVTPNPRWITNTVEKLSFNSYSYTACLKACFPAWCDGLVGDICFGVRYLRRNNSRVSSPLACPLKIYGDVTSALYAASVVIHVFYDSRCWQVYFITNEYHSTSSHKLASFYLGINYKWSYRIEIILCIYVYIYIYEGEKESK